MHKKSFARIGALSVFVLSGCATHTGVISLGDTLAPTGPGTYYTQVKTQGGVDGRITALDVQRCVYKDVCAQGCNDPYAIETGTFAMTQQLVCESQMAVVTSPGIVNDLLTVGGAAVSSAVFGAVGAAVLRPPQYENNETIQQTGGGAQSSSVSEGSQATSSSRSRSRSRSESQSASRAGAQAVHSPTTTSNRSLTTNIHHTNTTTVNPPMPMPGGHRD